MNDELGKLLEENVRVLCRTLALHNVEGPVAIELPARADEALTQWLIEKALLRPAVEQEQVALSILHLYNVEVRLFRRYPPA